MSVKNIILASVLAIVVLAAGSVIGCYFHYNNQEISLRQQSELSVARLRVFTTRCGRFFSRRHRLRMSTSPHSSPSIRNSLRADTQRETALL